MAEPTKEEKHAAARGALAAMSPPRTEKDIAPNTLEDVIAVVWSQMKLLSPVEPVPSPAAEPQATLMVTFLPKDDAQRQKALAISDQTWALIKEVAPSDG